jgi:hypothetical protein
MLKTIFREVCPPVVYRMLSSAIVPFKKRSDALFDGDDALFKKLLAQADVYAEYGCGASTIWVANNTRSRIITVDSSERWLNEVKQACENRDSLTLHFADVGSVGDWGTPINYDQRDKFNDYTDWIWKQSISPDVVLIDGRFRVCCFLTCLLFAEEGTCILFDDYTDRERYHFVELFLRPARTCGRQALFLVPSKDLLDVEGIREAARQFRFVFD